MLHSTRATIEPRIQYAKATQNEPVPLHLRNAPTALMKGMGQGRDYKYDHAIPEHHSERGTRDADSK